MKMSGNFLWDTNIAIAFYDQDPHILKRVAEAKIYVPSIVIGELWFGAEKSQKKASNQRQVAALIDEVSILPATETTAKHYGVIKNELKQQGRPIPENDIWIAAIAQEYALTLVTRDKHFSHVKGLKVEAW